MKRNFLIKISFFFSLLLIGIHFSSCSGDQGEPFSFGEGGGGKGRSGERTTTGKGSGSLSEGEGCLRNADCGDGESCQVSTGVCLALQCPGVTCGAGESLDTDSCACLSTCAVEYDATIALTGNSPIDPKFNFPADCEYYPDNEDLFCCSQEQELFCPDEAGPTCSTGHPHRFGIADCKATPGENKINTLSYFSDRPITMRLDVSNLPECRVFLSAKDFPNFDIANTALEASLRINMGGGQGEFAGMTGRGTCYEEDGKIHIENLSGLHFKVTFYQPVAFVDFDDPDFNPFAAPDPFEQIIPYFLEDESTPNSEAEGLSFTTGTASALGALGYNNVPALSVEGSPLQFNPQTGDAEMKLVAGLTVTAEADPLLGGGKLAGALGGGALVAEFRGVITNPAANDAPVTSLAELRDNCAKGSVETGFNSALALSVNHHWMQDADIHEGEDSIGLTGNAEDGFAGILNFRQKPYSRGYNLGETSSSASIPPRTNPLDIYNQLNPTPLSIQIGTGRTRTPPSSTSSSVEELLPQRFVSEEAISISNQSSTEELKLDIEVSPANGAFQLAEETFPTHIEPGQSVILPIRFSPGKNVAGCDENGIVCRSEIQVDRNRLTLALNGTGRTPSGKMKISQILYDDSSLGTVLPLPNEIHSATYFGDFLNDETTLQNTCRPKIYRVSNEGVLALSNIVLPSSDSSGHFIRKQVLQGESFVSAHGICLNSNPSTCGTTPRMEAISPMGESDLFFFLEYCPTRFSSESGDVSQYWINYSGGTFAYSIMGRADTKSDALAQIFISDFESYSYDSCSEAPKPADLVAPDGKCLYRVEDGAFSFRTNSQERDLYVANAKAKVGADSLRVLSIPELFDDGAGKFSFEPTATLPLTLSPCTAALGSGGSECLSCSAGSCKKMGVVKFDPISGEDFQVETRSFEIVTATVPSGGASVTLPPSLVQFMGANGTDKISGEKTAHAVRIFGGFDPKMANVVGLASAVTPGQVDSAGASEAWVDRYAIPIHFYPDEGRVVLPALNTPVPDDLTIRAPEGVSLFNTIGSGENTTEYLYNFECTGNLCRQFYINLGNRSLISNEEGGALYGLYDGSGSARALHPILDAAALENRFEEAGSEMEGFYDPVTGEISFENNVAVRIFSPQIQLLGGTDEVGTGDIDITYESSLTTECLDASLIPNFREVDGRITGGYPLDLDKPMLAAGPVDNSLVNVSNPARYEHYGDNPLPFYVEGGTGSVLHGCEEGVFHGRRLWAGEDHTSNLDQTGANDLVRNSSFTPEQNAAANRVSNPNFDLSAVGWMRGNEGRVHNKIMFLTIKLCLGEAGEAANSNLACR